jgi:hypothetical protein
LSLPALSACAADWMYVAIIMRSGRPPERKQALYRRIAELAQK